MVSSLLPSSGSTPLSSGSHHRHRIHHRRCLPNNPSTSSRAVRITCLTLVLASLCNSGGGCGNLPSGGGGGYGNLFSGGGGGYDDLSSGGGGGGYDNLFSGGGSEGYGKLFSGGGGGAGSEDEGGNEGGGDGDDASVNRREAPFGPSQRDAFGRAPDHIVRRPLQSPGFPNLECPPVSDFSNRMGATNPVEAEADGSNGNNHAQHEASRSVVTWTTAAGGTDNPSTLVVNTTENEKKNKAEVAFLFTIVDKMHLLSGVIISGILYSHGHTPLLTFSDAWIQALFAGGAISTFSCILLAGAASYFKEIPSPDHPVFVVCSTIVLWELILSLLLICKILLGFEGSPKCVIWSVGVLLLLSMVLVWVTFQRQPMKVWLKWTKSAHEWMLKRAKRAKNAFEWTKAKISKWKLRGVGQPQIKA